MPRIIYDPTDTEESYLVDKPAQEILAYLYLYGTAHPSDLIKHSNLHEETELVDVIEKVLSRDAAGFVVMRYGSQLDIEGEQLKNMQLTGEGKTFIENHQSEIAVPFSIEKVRRDMMEIASEIREILYRFEELIIDDEPDKVQDEKLEELINRMEAYFDDIRRNLPGHR